ncbi:phosphotransferase [Streptomyces sp. NPDC050997]|uniref:phosphotransferase n=1 Tax=Streptomyces sp. NPDC050997 TaxID=3155519 RepID=UPI003435E404
MEESVLGGGAVNEVVRVGGTVRRTPSPRRDYVRDLLTLFERRGWTGAPRHLGTDERGREVFAHIEGRAALMPPERNAARADACLVRVARLVRAFHDLTHDTPLAGDRDVVCHNDLAPKNTVYAVEGDAWRPLAFIDWDLAAPGERIHDVAHVCWQYLDLGPGAGAPAEAARRMRLICDAYGLDRRDDLVDTILWWQDRCWRGIEAGADRGEPAMVRLRTAGAVDEVRGAWRWVAGHRQELEDSPR